MTKRTIVETPEFRLDFDAAQVKFIDMNGNECSIQESSSAMPRLWLGIQKPHRQSLPSNLSATDYDEVCKLFTRAHLSKVQALEIGRAMVAWAERQADVVMVGSDETPD